MKSNRLYEKFLLTVIAVALVTLVFQNQTKLHLENQKLVNQSIYETTNTRVVSNYESVEKEPLEVVLVGYKDYTANQMGIC